MTREFYATSEYPHASTKAPIPVKVRGRGKCGDSHFFFFWRKAPRRQSNWAKILSGAKLGRKSLDMLCSNHDEVVDFGGMLGQGGEVCNRRKPTRAVT